MNVLAGVDEAGLGPLLGPLTIGWSALRVPELGADLWELLDVGVTRDPKADATHVVVDDSKRVFTRNARGRKRLETTALAFLAQLDADCVPPSACAWLFREPLAPPRELLERHPWYAALPERLPVHQEAGALELRADRLRRTLEAAGVELAGAGVRLVPAGELNDSFDETRSKSATLYDKTADVLRHLWTQYAEEGVRVVCDQHGARRNYGRALADTFPEAEVRLVKEEGEWKRYELRGRRRPGGSEPLMLVDVTPKADLKSFPTALASCLAKYARETCMAGFNSWFGERQPGLAPTAGYTADGRRWVKDAMPAIRREGVPERLLVRQR